MKRFLKAVLILSSVLGASIASTVTHAADFPTKPIRYIAPFVPGGGTDILSRQVAASLSKVLGQPVIVENKPGAGGGIGAQFVAQSPPDGYTILASTSGMLTLPYFTAAGYDMQKDLEPLVMLSTGNLVLIVADSLPVKTMAEFIAYAKANPGKLNYASSGVGSAVNLAWELLKSKAGIDVVHIPFKGSADVVQAMASGTVHTTIDTIGTQLPLLAAGKTRALATTGFKRDSALPNVPTVLETKTVPDYTFTYWFGAHVPAKTPQAIIDVLAKAFAVARQDPGTQERIRMIRTDIGTNTREEFKAQAAAEAVTWDKLIRDTGLNKK